MKNERLLQLAGVQLNEYKNNMTGEYVAGIGKAVSLAVDTLMANEKMTKEEANQHIKNRLKEIMGKL